MTNLTFADYSETLERKYLCLFFLTYFEQLAAMHKMVKKYKKRTFVLLCVAVSCAFFCVHEVNDIYCVAC